MLEMFVCFRTQCQQMCEEQIEPSVVLFEQILRSCRDENNGVVALRIMSGALIKQ